MAAAQLGEDEDSAAPDEPRPNPGLRDSPSSLYRNGSFSTPYGMAFFKSKCTANSRIHLSGSLENQPSIRFPSAKDNG